MKVIFILIFLLFLPIPVKLDLLYKEFIVNLKLYNKTIINFDLRNISDYINIKNESKEKNKKLSFFKKYFQKKEIIFKKLFLKLNSNKFKPFIKIKNTITFGISDAFICALIYGLLCNTVSIIQLFFNLLFNIKNISLSINPKFNTNYLLFNINSIFYISFANIIYMIFLLFNCLKNKEEIINE
ncbi:DUF2953 domain-containing protein [Clostridium sp.]|uniref:DUF2953 domain-containing protein n=1 Tax=Clostridium sp. TaxID=1506 RepID=UPI003457101D